MFFSGIGNAKPKNRYSKMECLEAFQKSEWYKHLDLRALYIARTVLQRDNGIETRWLAVNSLEEVFKIDPNTLAARYTENAPSLATNAAKKALENAALKSKDIDALIVSTCTGYVCPGLSGYVAERLGMRANVLAYDLVGQGCAAALPNMQLCEALLIKECEHVLSICVEVSSAAMYLDNDPGVLISACLFGDGAGAAILSRKSRHPNRNIEWIDSTSIIDPSERKALMFEQKNGMLRNILSRAVPTLAAKYAHEVFNIMINRHNLKKQDINTWVMHAGGRDVLLELEREFELRSMDFKYSAAMLREYGNLSSAFVYFVIEAALSDSAPDGWWWLSSFGAGFSCHGALLKVS